VKFLARPYTVRRSGDVFGKGHKAPAVLASVLGIALVAVQGMTYAAPAMVAIANGLTMLLFFITVWVMGCAAIPLLNLAPAVAALRQGLLCVWRS
jgi:DMSO reductase anchor subunit